MAIPSSVNFILFFSVSSILENIEFFSVDEVKHGIATCDGIRPSLSSSGLAFSIFSFDLDFVSASLNLSWLTMGVGTNFSGLTTLIFLWDSMATSDSTIKLSVILIELSISLDDPLGECFAMMT